MMNKMSKSAVLGLALMVSLLAAGCGRSGAEPEEGVLRVWTTWAGDAAQLQALFDRFSQGSGVPVKVKTGVDSDDVLKALAGATPPDVVVLSSSDPVRAYAEQGLLEPLGGWIEATGIDLDDTYPAALAQCQARDGTILCLPWGCDVHALFWNKDLFAAAGLDPERPPQTMEELAGFAGRLTLRDEEGDLSQIGFVPDLARPHLELYARMFGGAWASDAGDELKANAQPLVNAMRWQSQFYAAYGQKEARGFVRSIDRYTGSSHPEFAGRRLNCRQCHRSAAPKVEKLPEYGFLDGRVGMMAGGQWLVGLEQTSGVPAGPSYGVAPFPPPAGHLERAGTAVIEGAVALIPSGAKDKAAAADLLAWMMSPEIVADVAYAGSSLPSSRRAARDPRFGQIPELQVFLDLLVHPNARAAVATPIRAELNEALGEVEDKVLRNGGDPVTLLAEVQAEFAPRLREGLAFGDGP